MIYFRKQWLQYTFSKRLYIYVTSCATKIANSSFILKKEIDFKKLKKKNNFGKNWGYPLHLFFVFIVSFFLLFYLFGWFWLCLSVSLSFFHLNCQYKCWIGLVTDFFLLFVQFTFILKVERKETKTGRHFFAITCFFAITLKNYKMCLLKLNRSLIMHLWHTFTQILSTHI